MWIHTTYLKWAFSVFTVFLFFGTDKAFGAECDANMAVGTKCECPFDISALSFVGEKFSGSVFCIKASTDNEARGECTKYGYSYINPGNPDYLSAANRAYGDQNSNILSFYYCTKGIKKQDMCNAAKAKYPQLKFKWIPVGNAIHKDGMCQCDKNGNSTLEDCSGPDVPEIQKSAGKKCEGTHQVLSANGEACECANGYRWDQGGQGRVCVQSETLAQNPTTEPSPEIVQCMKEFENQASQCVNTANAAEKTCDQEDTDNDEVSQVMKIPGSVAKQFVSSKQGTGMVSECMKAGAVAGGSKYLMDSLSTKCEDNYKSCETTCGEENYNKHDTKCSELAKKNLTDIERSALNRGEAQVIQNADYRYYSSRVSEIKKTFDQGTPICKVDAAKKKDVLSSVLSDIGSSFLAAQRCACQVAASLTGVATSTCDSLPTAEQCVADPTLAACPAVVAIDICSQGSPNYSAQGCVCQTNPKGPGCSEYVASVGNLSGFAGADIGNPSTGSGVNIGAGSGGGALGAGDLDISGNRANDAALPTKTPGISTGFNSGGGGGGGGGLGAAPSSGGDLPNGGDGDGGEGGGIGGVLGFVKSIPGSIMNSLTKKKNEAPGAGQKTMPSNMNRFRPLRGVASDIGGKNMDIWDMMHVICDDVHPTFKSDP